MNKLILAAAACSALITVAHIVGGGAQYHAPILAGSLDLENKAIYSILWHFASLIMAINTLALLRIAFGTGHRFATQLIAWQNLAFAGLFVFYGAVRLGSVFILPQWTLFVVIAVLAYMGTRHHGTPADI